MCGELRAQDLARPVGPQRLVEGQASVDSKAVPREDRIVNAILGVLMHKLEDGPEHPVHVSPHQVPALGEVLGGEVQLVQPAQV